MYMIFCCCFFLFFQVASCYLPWRMSITQSYIRWRLGTFLVMMLLMPLREALGGDYFHCFNLFWSVSICFNLYNENCRILACRPLHIQLTFRHCVRNDWVGWQLMTMSITQSPINSYVTGSASISAIFWR